MVRSVFASRAAVAGSGNGSTPISERVAGGMTRNDFFLQLQADLLGIPVVRPPLTETTALGAAYLAGLTVGVFESGEEIAARRHSGQRFEPALPCEERDARYVAGGARLHKRGCAPDPAKHGAPRMRKGAMTAFPHREWAAYGDQLRAPAPRQRAVGKCRGAPLARDRAIVGRSRLLGESRTVFRDRPLSIPA